MNLQIRYNRTARHITGLEIRTESTGADTGQGTVADYSESHCPALTRSGRRMTAGKTYDNAKDALYYAELGAKIAGQKMCQHCRKAAEAMI